MVLPTVPNCDGLILGAIDARCQLSFAIDVRRQKRWQKRANMFKSRADMEQWIAWLNKPEKPEGHSGKVVHLKKPR